MGSIAPGMTQLTAKSLPQFQQTLADDVGEWVQPIDSIGLAVNNTKGMFPLR